MEMIKQILKKEAEGIHVGRSEKGCASLLTKGLSSSGYALS